MLRHIFFRFNFKLTVSSKTFHTKGGCWIPKPLNPSASYAQSDCEIGTNRYNWSPSRYSHCATANTNGNVTLLSHSQTQSLSVWALRFKILFPPTRHVCKSLVTLQINNFSVLLRVTLTSEWVRPMVHQQGRRWVYS